MTALRRGGRSSRVAIGVLASAALLASCASATTPTVSSGASPSLAAEAATPPAASPTAAPSSSATSSPAVSPSPSQTASVTPVAAAGPFDVSWDVAARPATGKARDWEALTEQVPVWTALGDRTVMIIGYDTTPQTWSSEDGIHWTASKLPGAVSEFQLAAVTRGGPGLVAWAETGDAPAIWTSTDGLTWSRTDTSPLSDGQQWLLQQVAHGATWAGPVDVSTFAGQPFTGAGDGDVTVAASSDGVSVYVPSEGPIAVWRSTGGGPWAQVGSVAGSDGGRFKLVASGPRGWVAFGCTGECLDEAAWTSSDGVAWAPAAKPPSGSPTSVIGIPDGFVAAGSTTSGGGCVRVQNDVIGETWTSGDGSTWRSMTKSGLAKGSDVAGLIPDASTLIGVGVALRRPDGTAPVAWTATIAPPPGVAPKPTPTPAPGGC